MMYLVYEIVDNSDVHSSEQVSIIGGFYSPMLCLIKCDWTDPIFFRFPASMCPCHIIALVDKRYPQNTV